MPKVKKSPKKKQYSEANVNQCLLEIRRGMSVRAACQRNRIPRSTINFRLGKMCKEQGRTGPPTAICHADEIELVNWIKKMARKGFPVTRYRIMSRVTSYIKKHPEKGIFKNGKPSKEIFHFLNEAAIKFIQ